MYKKYAELRDSMGLTDYKVAKESGVLTSTLSEWKKHYESGGEQGYQPKLEKLNAIANVLGVSVTEFIE